MCARIAVKAVPAAARNSSVSSMLSWRKRARASSVLGTIIGFTAVFLIGGLAGQVALPAPTARRDDLQPMTTSERLDELAQILSAGLRRILPEQSSSLSAQTRDSFVDFSPLRSGVRRHKLRNRVGG